MIEWNDKENHVAVIALQNCGIERAHIFELPKPLNIMRVFVYRTVKLFLDAGGVRDHKDPADFAWFVRHKLLMLLGQELTKLLSEKKKL